MLLQQLESIFFIDADDVLAPNRLQQFLSEMQAQDADLCYGKKIKVHDLKEAQQRQTPIWEASTQSLKYMIDHNLMQMCVMCTRELFIRSTGCNENIFIQDESLALNLGLQSQKIISTTLPSAFVILDPEETKINRGENRLSRHLEQQHYDMFYTLYDFISLNPKLGHQVHHLLLKKLLSTYWKSKKEQQQAHLFDCYIYLLSKVSPTYAWKRYHAVLTYYFNNLDHVRKCVERVSA